MATGAGAGVVLVEPGPALAPGWCEEGVMTLAVLARRGGSHSGRERVISHEGLTGYSCLKGW